MNTKTSILFVCEGNSFRSVMAEALAKQRLGARAVVRSAGLNPKPEYDSKSAIQTLKDEFGIDASGHRQTHIRDVEIKSFDCVIAMDAAIAKPLKRLTSHEIITWPIDDPWGEIPPSTANARSKYLSSYGFS